MADRPTDRPPPVRNHGNLAERDDRLVRVSPPIVESVCGNAADRVLADVGAVEDCRGLCLWLEGRVCWNLGVNVELWPPCT